MYVKIFVGYTKSKQQKKLSFNTRMFNTKMVLKMFRK